MKLGYARKEASMVRYTTPLPWIGLSKNDSKLYTNYDFFEGKTNHKQLKNTLIYKAKQLMLTNVFLKKSVNFLEDSARRYIEHVIG